MASQLSLFGGVDTSSKSEVGPVPLDDDDEVKRIAAELPSSIRIGTSSWSFPGWAGLVYDRSVSKPVLARRGLAAYAQHPLLRMVGVDRSYYAPLEEKVFAEYAAAVPEDFRFLVKACEQCTVGRYPRHARYGEQGGKINPFYLDPGFTSDEVVGPYVTGLGDKAGPLVFQFPPQQRSAMGGKDFAGILYDFLAALPPGPTYAVEIRDAALLTREYAVALESAGAFHCYNVHPKMPSPLMQRRFVPIREQLVVRWMLGHGQEYEAAKERYQPFDRIVDAAPATRNEIAELCVEANTINSNVSVSINNKAEGSAPLSARALAAAIATSLSR